MLFLYILWKIIKYILLVLFIVLLAVLIIPFKYYSTGEKIESVLLNGSVSWLFGGLKMRFTYSSNNGYNMEINFLGIKKKIDNSKGKFQNRLRNLNNVKNSIKNKSQKPAYSYFTYEVLKKGLQAALKLLNHCKPKQFQLEASAGFEDPLYTGLLYGIKNAGFAISDKCNIHIGLTFEEEELKGSFKIGGGIRVFYLLLVMMEFVFTRPFRSILIKNIKNKRRLKRWRLISISTKA